MIVGRRLEGRAGVLWVWGNVCLSVCLAGCADTGGGGAGRAQGIKGLKGAAQQSSHGASSNCLMVWNLGQCCMSPHYTFACNTLLLRFCNEQAVAVAVPPAPAGFGPGCE